MRAYQKGFTLVEVMIVVAIIAILAAIVIPSYQSAVRKAHRTDAKTALATIAQLMERYNTQNNTYVGRDSWRMQRLHHRYDSVPSMQRERLLHDRHEPHGHDLHRHGNAHRCAGC